MRGAEVNWPHVKTCSLCRGSNRAFANFCRACGEPLSVAEGNWIGYKGGVQRLGSTTALYREPVRELEIVDTGLDLRLGSVCRSLLGYDGHLIAVAKSGTIEITDPRRPSATQRFQVPGPVSAEACIDGGVLYVGTPGQIAAYSLGTMTLSTPRSRLLWRMPVSGAPIQALTPLGDRLYVSVASDGRNEVVAIDGIRSAQPSQPRTIHTARHVSWIAADPARAEAVFLSEDGNGVQVHVSATARAELVNRPVSLDSFAEHPIAFLGGSVFALFDDDRLYRIDPATGGIDETLGDDTQLFSLTRNDDEWDRGGVQIDSSGIVFSRAGVKDTFSHLERAVKGSPVIVHGHAAAVGMDDGRVLLYDMARPPKHEVWRLGAAGTPITALASFDSFIAAGNVDGFVGMRELRVSAGTS
jgi:hypothetical protein